MWCLDVPLTKVSIPYLICKKNSKPKKYHTTYLGEILLFEWTNFIQPQKIVVVYWYGAVIVIVLICVVAILCRHLVFVQLLKYWLICIKLYDKVPKHKRKVGNEFGAYSTNCSRIRGLKQTIHRI